MIDAILNKKLKKAIKELKDLTPPPMNKMLDQPSRRRKEGKACPLLMCQQQILVGWFTCSSSLIFDAKLKVYLHAAIYLICMICITAQNYC